jgi:hypothetical protein
MSRMYILHLNTPIEPVELLMEAYWAIGMEGTESEITVRDRTMGREYTGPRYDGMFREWSGTPCDGMVIIAENRVTAHSEIKERFDVDLDKSLFFLISNLEDFTTQAAHAVKVVSHLLEKYEGDMLFEDTHNVSLIRKAGTIIIDPRISPLPYGGLDQVKIPYRIAELGPA